MTAAIEAARTASVTRLPSWAELNRQWLIAAMARLRERLEERLANAGAGQPPVDCIDATEATGFTPALAHCARAFGLSAFERELLLLAAGVELDQGLRAAVSALQSDASSRASFGVALASLAAPHWQALSPDAALRYWHLVEPEPGMSLMQAGLRIDERVLHYITGIVAFDAQLAGIACLASANHELHAEDRGLASRIAEQLGAGEQRGPIVVLQDHDRDVASRRDFALGVAAHARRAALWMEARDLPLDAESAHRLAIHVDREVALSGCVPIIALGEPGTDAGAVALATRLRSAHLWLGPPHRALSALPRGGRVLRFELPMPSAPRTLTALAGQWRRLSPVGLEADPAARDELERAGRQFHLGATALDTVLAHLETTPAAERAAQIWPAARAAARGDLDDIAQRIESRVTFDDVVLPAGPASMLRDIARQLRQRDRVYREWGFGAKHRLGQGLVALFAGESGTGKTLAAEAIANAVELDLYRVDLATLVSKYIGETEKNLKRLFDTAETSGAVLLFDEADALFGKRSEVKDSHDRYANIEVAYLLQRVEAYRGLAVLTTNMKGALDQAFLRRIRFVVSFPFPDASAREQIWRRQFPVGAPVGDVDFAALARLNLPGGNIRSIAVNAAFKAADAGCPINQSLVLLAAREEFAKLDRPANDIELRGAR
ncbi:MAG: ATP-binding protein [Reyranella sp.]